MVHSSFTSDLGLPCCTPAFSLVEASRVGWLEGACNLFVRCASFVGAHGMRIFFLVFPEPGSESIELSLASAGGFLTTEAPGS